MVRFTDVVIEVFALLKSFGRAFSKARAGGGRGALLAVATAKRLGGVSFCQAFSLRLFQPKKKRVLDSGEAHGYRKIKNIFCGGFSLSHFSCFFFRKRRNKRNQTEREKRRKAPQSRWAFWRNGSFASSAQTVSRHLGVTAGTNPVRKSDSTGFARLLRWWAEVVRSPLAASMSVIVCRRWSFAR